MFQISTEKISATVKGSGKFHVWVLLTEKNVTQKKYLNTNMMPKKTWHTMEELVGKTKLKSSNLARKIIFNEGDIFVELKIVIEFKSFFTNIGRKLASKIPNASTTLESYIIYSFIWTLFIVDNH